MLKSHIEKTLHVLSLWVRHVALGGVLGAISIPAGGFAQSAAAVETLGTRTCAELVDAQQNDKDLYRAFGMWVGGFLTAANAYEPDTFDLTPWQPIEYITAQVTSGCRSQPDKSVAQATNSYVGFLRENRLAAPSKLLRVRANDNAMFIYEAVLADVRAKLEGSGFTITDDANTYGDTFGRAIVSYQQQHNLPKTGLPDLPTLSKLFQR